MCTLQVFSANVAALGKTFVTVHEYFVAYCMYSEAVKLFRFLVSPYSLIETYNSAQCALGELWKLVYCHLFLNQSIVVTNALL